MKYLILLFVVAITSKSFADILSDAAHAYERGDYTAAITSYEKLAKQGDAQAQLNLGWMYDNGEGTPQDYVMAHMLWNIAAANGDEDAKGYRDKVAGMMTQNQIEKAQELAREWMEKY